MSAELEARMQRLAAQMLDEAPPVTASEAVRHRLRLGDAPARNGAPVDVDTLTSAPRPSARSARRRRGVWAVSGAVAAASVLVVGLAAVTGRDGDDDDPQQQVAGAPVNPATRATDASTSAAPATTSAPAQAAVAPEQLHWPPRVLLDGGWEVVTANERSFSEGYVTFASGGVTVFVGWYRGDVLLDESWYESHGFTAVGSATLLGHPVSIYAGQDGYRVGDIHDLIDQGVLPTDILGGPSPSLTEAPSTEPEERVDDDDLVGGPMLEEQLSEAIAAGQIEGVPTQGLETSLIVDAASLSVKVMSGDPDTTLSVEEFSDLLAGLRQVETAEWDAAMPERVVTPAERPDVIDEMMTGVPLPDMSDPSGGGEDLYQDRIELAAELANSVACAWLNRFFTAAEGSPEAAEALDALESIPNWPVSQELAEATANPAEGEIPPSSAVIPFLTVNADGTLSYAGEVLDGYFAAQLCDPNAVG